MDKYYRLVVDSCYDLVKVWRIQLCTVTDLRWSLLMKLFFKLAIFLCAWRKHDRWEEERREMWRKDRDGLVCTYTYVKSNKYVPQIILFKWKFSKTLKLCSWSWNYRQFIIILLIYLKVRFDYGISSLETVVQIGNSVVVVQIWCHIRISLWCFNSTNCITEHKQFQYISRNCTPCGNVVGQLLIFRFQKMCWNCFFTTQE